MNTAPYSGVMCMTSAHHLPGKYNHLYLTEKITWATDEGGEKRG